MPQARSARRARRSSPRARSRFAGASWASRKVPGPRSGRARAPDREGVMRIVSVNVGLPRAVTWRGKTVTTAIFKEPIAGRVALRSLNLDGDRQADLTVHGGRGKAVYAYPVGDYRHWRHRPGAARA